MQTTITFERTNSDGYSWDYRNDPNRPELSYGFDVASPASWQWKDISAGTSVAVLPRSEIRLRPNGVETLFQAAQFDVEFDLDERITLKAGVNLKTFESDSEQFRRTDETWFRPCPPGSRSPTSPT